MLQRLYIYKVTYAFMIFCIKPPPLPNITFMLI